MRASPRSTLLLGAAAGALLSSGCVATGDPLTEGWTWWLGDIPIGRESRRWEQGGDAVEVSLQLGPGSPPRSVRWQRDGDGWRSAIGAGLWVEQLPPGPHQGPLPLVQLTSGEVTWSEVRETPEGRVVLTPVAPIQLRMANRQVVSWHQSRLEAAPDPTEPDLHDPAPLLALPCSPLADPRRQRRVIFRIDGEEHLVQGLLPAEISRTEGLPSASPRGPWAESVERARAESRSTWELAHHLMALAGSRVRQAPTLVQDPIQTWIQGQGDCSERAALLVALARDAGLSARTVEGLVYLDDPPRLVPHAWAELQLGGRWVPADPSLNQLPADATHLAAPAERVARWCLEGAPAVAEGEPRRRD